MAKKFALFLVLSTASVSAACGSEDDDPADGAGDGAITQAALRGGALYDKYWSLTSDAEPTTDHPLWASRPDMMSNARTGADTWRCKECHGWDYKGNQGAYAMGSHATGFPGIFGSTKTVEEISTLLADPAGHAYTTLSATDLQALAEFITTGLMDTNSLIAAGKFSGDVATGDPLYQGSCASCHGADGLNAMPPGSAGGFGDFPGKIANENAVEYLHKVRFGQPGTAMPAQAALLTPEQLGALGAFSQTLPMAAP